jgi:thiol-disulfide isomerase/thioredoxin
LKIVENCLKGLKDCAEIFYENYNCTMQSNSKKLLIVLIIIPIIIYGIRKFMQYKTPPKMGFNATQLITVDDNKNITINDYLGKVVIVSCFQTWCGSCAAETPVLNQLATNLKSSNFQVIYVTDEANDKLTSFRSRLASEKILFTFSENKLEKLGIYVYPTTFLINKKGEVIKTKLEGYDWLQDEALINKLISE